MPDEKTTVWIADIEGRKATVDDFVDWRPHGWVETTEPAGEEFVWLEHEETHGKQLFPAAVVDQWSALGWKPSAPPSPVDLTRDPNLTDVPDEPVPAKPTKATSGSKKEQQ